MFELFFLAILKHTKCTSPPTVEGFLSKAKPNPQSQLYCFMNTIMAVPNLIDLLPFLSSNMDWVGFTEDYDETMMVLQHVLQRNDATSLTKRNETRRNLMKRKMLNQKKTLYLFMRQDYDLYRGLDEEFRADEMVEVQK